ncbi:TRAP transporter large permease [Halomonas aquatica]|uniref:TRAP transporter large permease protein n=1 Tax=Halomonas aquatica TaxID=3151123 RepID=A0ABV1NC56_9GAMM
MEWYTVAIGLFALLMLLVSIGVPIPFALAGAALPFLWSIQSFSTSVVSSELQLWGVWFNYILLAIPLFVFLGELIGRSRVGSDLYRFLHSGVNVRGAAAYGSIGACAGFGAVSGSSMVGSLTIGGVALKEMLHLKYDRRLASGILAAGGTLSVLIPPSLIMIYYGIVTDQSIGNLFIAGIIPGIILTSMFVIIVLVWSRLHRSHVPDSDNATKLPRKRIIAALTTIGLIGFIIIASIYTGLATPTEAAAVAAVITFVLTACFGGLTFSGFVEALKRTMLTMGYVGLLLSAGTLFGFVVTYYRIPDELTSLITSMGLSPYVILAVVIVAYILLGMFLEPVSMTFITLPTIFPLIHAAGFDLIWFGVVYTVIMEIAVLTPPVGLNLYVIQGLAKDDVSVGDVIVGSLPFIGALVLLVLALLVVPEIALWLPEIMS